MKSIKLSSETVAPAEETRDASAAEETGFPPSFFDRFAGVFADDPIERGDQGVLEEREPLDELLVLNIAFDQSEYVSTARRLAASHRAADPDTRFIFLSPDIAEREIRLLEVSASAATTRQLDPFTFEERPDLGIEFPLVVLLLSPAEWSEVTRGELALPQGWDRARLIEVPAS